MIEKYCNFEVTAMKILVKSNQRYYDNCELFRLQNGGSGWTRTTDLTLIRGAL